MASEKSIDNCKVLHSIKLNGIDYVLAEKNVNDGIRYRLYLGNSDNAFGIAEYSMIDWSSDYLTTMHMLIRQIEKGINAISVDRLERGNPMAGDAPITQIDCVPNSLNENLVGKVIAIKAESLYPEYRALSHQLCIATGGFGTSPTARGRKVYVTNVYSGEKEQFNRSDILGVVLPKRIPKWAHDKISALSQNQNEQPQYESVLAKIKEGKSSQTQEQNANNKDNLPQNVNKNKKPNKNSER
jgi:hypothetical protein